MGSFCAGSKYYCRFTLLGYALLCYAFLVLSFVFVLDVDYNQVRFRKSRIECKDLPRTSRFPSFYFIPSFRSLGLLHLSLYLNQSRHENHIK